MTERVRMKRKGQTCSIEGCEGPVSGRGWCGKHYQRWRQFGDPMREPDPAPSLIERIIAKTELNGDCWEWTDCLNAQGYGLINVDRRSRLAHRVTYQELVGEITEPHLDHICRNRKCVNPDHLEPVTAGENHRRGARGAGKRRVTHCPKGHAYTPENTIASGTRRTCKTCHREASLNYWRKKNLNTRPDLEVCGSTAR